MRRGGGSWKPISNIDGDHDHDDHDDHDGREKKITKKTQPQQYLFFPKNKREEKKKEC